MKFGHRLRGLCAVMVLGACGGGSTEAPPTPIETAIEPAATPTVIVMDDQTLRALEVLLSDTRSFIDYQKALVDDGFGQLAESECGDVIPKFRAQRDIISGEGNPRLDAPLADLQEAIYNCPYLTVADHARADDAWNAAFAEIENVMVDAGHGGFTIEREGD